MSCVASMPCQGHEATLLQQPSRPCLMWLLCECCLAQPLQALASHSWPYMAMPKQAGWLGQQRQMGEMAHEALSPSQEMDVWHKEPSLLPVKEDVVG